MLKGQKLRKTKETKEGKEKMLLRTISVENVTEYGDNVCKFAMCTLIKSQISPTCSYELFMCNKTNHNICYTIISYEVHTFKNENKI